MASALAPNIGAQLAFRFLAGFFGSTPLTCAGGSIADMWNPLERVYAFPIFANAAFTGPVLGPVIGGFVSAYFEVCLILPNTGLSRSQRVTPSHGDGRSG